MDRLYAGMRETSTERPFFVEMGVVDDPTKGDKAQWLREAYRDTRSGRWPALKGIWYWNETTSGHREDGTSRGTALDSSPASLAAYRDNISDPFFLDAPTLSCPAGASG